MVGVEIEDTGSGMDTETMDRIFEPFFTTKSDGAGHRPRPQSGLWLRQPVGRRGQSRQRAGPGHRSDPHPAGVDTSPLADAPPSNPMRALPPAAILVVEDNEDVGAFAETLLSELGHQVTRAATGEEALDLARKPELRRGLERRGHARHGRHQARPGAGGRTAELPVVLATGYSQEIAEGGSGGRPVILKPYRLATLSEALAEAMRRAT